MKTLSHIIGESILDTTTDDVERVALIEEISQSLQGDNGTEITVRGKDIMVGNPTHSDCSYLYVRKPFSKKIMDLFERIVVQNHTNVYFECELHFGKNFIGVWNAESSIRVMVQGDTTGLEVTSPTKVWVGEDWQLKLPDSYQFKGKIKAIECVVTLKNLPFYPLDINAKKVTFVHPDDGTWSKKRASWRRDILSIEWNNVYVRKLFPKLQNCNRISFEIGTISPQNGKSGVNAQYFPKTEHRAVLNLNKDWDREDRTKDKWSVELDTAKHGYESGQKSGSFANFLMDKDR